MEAEGQVRNNRVRNEPTFTAKHAADGSCTRRLTEKHEHLLQDEKPCKPPLVYVVVQDTPSNSTKTSSAPQPIGSFTGASASSGRASMNCMQPFFSAFLPAQAPASPFKLQPRGKASSRPFGPASKGRKRTAHTLNSQQNPPETFFEESLVGRSCTENESALSPLCKHPDVCSETSLPRRRTMNRMEVSMESLSLRSQQSPGLGNDMRSQISKQRHVVHAGMSLPPRAPANSIMGCSRSGAQSQLKPRAGNIGSLGSSHNTLPSSPESSSTPSSFRKYAPLTVLPKVGNEARTPQTMSRRPQRGSSACMMLSLDGSSTKEEFNESQDETVVAALSFPYSLPESVACSPHGSTDSSITKEYTPARRFGVSTPSTPRNNGHIPSPICLSSPANMAKQTIESAHSTPLPSIKLTPRTPRSSASHHNTIEHATPLSACDLGLLHTDFLEDQTAPSSDGPSALLTGRPSYLPIPHWCNDAPTEESLVCPSSRVLSHAAESESSYVVTEARMHENERFPALNTRSLLASPPSGEIFDEMLLEQAETDAVMNVEDGSLSDPDEDVPFVLADPAALAEERQQLGPSRRRQRVSYGPLDQNGFHPSSGMAPSPFASNASLLGVGILRGESTTSLPGSNRCDDTKYAFCEESRGVSLKDSSYHEYTSGFASHRGKQNASHDSLCSVGLEEWDQGEEESRKTVDRELVTPPATDYHMKISPTFEEGAYQHQLTPSRNVRISLSDPAAVRDTIASMAFNSGLRYDASPRQMRCPS